MAFLANEIPEAMLHTAQWLQRLLLWRLLPLILFFLFLLLLLFLLLFFLFLLLFFLFVLLLLDGKHNILIKKGHSIIQINRQIKHHIPSIDKLNLLTKTYPLLPLPLCLLTINSLHFFPMMAQTMEIDHIMNLRISQRVVQQTSLILSEILFKKLSEFVAIGSVSKFLQNVCVFLGDLSLLEARDD